MEADEEEDGIAQPQEGKNFLKGERAPSKEKKVSIETHLPHLQRAKHLRRGVTKKIQKARREGEICAHPCGKGKGVIASTHGFGRTDPQGGDPKGKSITETRKRSRGTRTFKPLILRGPKSLPSSSHEGEKRD